MKNKFCPFCGSSQLSVEHATPAWGGTDKEAHIVCDNCASSSPIYIWNKRDISLSNAASTQVNTSHTPAVHKLT